MRFWVLAAFAGVLALAGLAQADDRPLRGVALVIGQSEYTGTLPKLANKDKAMIKDGRAAVQHAYAYYKNQNGAETYCQNRLAAIDTLLKSVK